MFQIHDYLDTQASKTTHPFPPQIQKISQTAIYLYHDSYHYKYSGTFHHITLDIHSHILISYYTFLYMVPYHITRYIYVHIVNAHIYICNHHNMGHKYLHNSFCISHHSIYKSIYDHNNCTVIHTFANIYTLMKKYKITCDHIWVFKNIILNKAYAMLR